jgi:hypothetical protein
MRMTYGLKTAFNARNLHHPHFQRHRKDVSAKMENTLRNMKAFLDVRHALWARFALKELATSLWYVMPVRLGHILMLPEQKAILRAQSVQQDHHQKLAQVHALLAPEEKHQFWEVFAILAHQVPFRSLQKIVRPHQHAFLAQKDILHPIEEVLFAYRALPDSGQQWALRTVQR